MGNFANFVAEPAKFAIFFIIERNVQRNSGLLAQNTKRKLALFKRHTGTGQAKAKLLGFNNPTKRSSQSCSLVRSSSLVQSSLVNTPQKYKETPLWHIATEHLTFRTNLTRLSVLLCNTIVIIYSRVVLQPPGIRRSENGVSQLFAVFHFDLSLASGQLQALYS